MKITTKKKDSYTLEVGIELDAGELSAYLDRVAGDMAGQVSVPGFRKGKAPKERATQKLDKAALREEALQHAMEESFSKAATQEHWDIAGTADLKVSRNDTQGLTYSVIVHLWPAVTLPDPTTIKVPRKPIQVADAEVDEALETLRGLRATFLDKTGTVAQGDRIEVDFDAFLDGKSLEGGSSKNHPLIVGGKSFMPGFEEQLIGLTAGMSKEFSLTAPADYYEPKLAGKRVDFKVTLRRVQVVLKPAIDDAFVKSVGEFTDLNNLRTALRDGIVREKEEKERQRVRLAILDAIADAAQPPVSDHMVARELDAMLRRFTADLAGRGLALPLYLARLNTTEEKIKEGWRPEAQRQVRIALVLRQLAKDRNIQVSREELDDALTATIAELAREGQDAKRIDSEQLRTALTERLLRDKLLVLIEHECAVQA